MDGSTTVVQVLVGLLGVAVLATVLVDIAVTVLAPGAGAGPLTRALGHGIWSLVIRLRSDGGDSWLRHVAGPAVLAATGVQWVVGLVGGFSLVLASLGEGHLQLTTDGATYEAGMATYVAVTTVFTLGLGDVVPTTGLGRVVVAAATVLGLLLLSLVVTYLLPVVTSAGERRILASQLRSLGPDARTVSRSIVDELRPASVDQALLQVALLLRTTTQHHLTHPVLHYFQARRQQDALAPALAAFTEGVLDALPRTDASPAALRDYLHAVDGLLEVTRAHTAGHLRDDPPPPLWEQGDGPGPEHDERRRWLAALLADSGWTWDHAVHGTRPPTARV